MVKLIVYDDGNRLLITTKKEEPMFLSEMASCGVSLDACDRHVIKGDCHCLEVRQGGLTIR